MPFLSKGAPGESGDPGLTIGEPEQGSPEEASNAVLFKAAHFGYQGSWEGKASKTAAQHKRAPWDLVGSAGFALPQDPSFLLLAAKRVKITPPPGR